MEPGLPPDPQGTGFERMGAPIGFQPRAKVYEHMKDMGATNREKMMECVNGMADLLERDEPYRAMEHACKYLDYVGACRLMAVLLCERNEVASPALQETR